MKKIVSALSTVAILLAITTSMPSCASKTSKEKKEKSVCCAKPKTATTPSCCANSNQTINTDKVNVLYFHATRRCASCEAVEKVTREALTEYYGDKVDFKSVNREENKELAKKYNIEWQSLIIIKGDSVINLTNDAFLNARTNPDKLKAKIKSSIDQMK